MPDAIHYYNYYLSLTFNAVLLIVVVQAYRLDRTRKATIAALTTQRDFYKLTLGSLLHAGLDDSVIAIEPDDFAFADAVEQDFDAARKADQRLVNQERYRASKVH